jgi:hypothetical protein
VLYAEQERVVVEQAAELTRHAEIR